MKYALTSSCRTKRKYTMVNLLGLVEREAKVLGSAFADLAELHP
jgi:hypothetical protein